MHSCSDNLANAVDSIGRGKHEFTVIVNVNSEPLLKKDPPLQIKVSPTISVYTPIDSDSNSINGFFNL